MTTFLLVRHAAHDLLGNTLAGRTHDIGINAHGREQARELVARLRGLPLAAVYVSPRRRARETIEPLVDARGIGPRVLEALDEIDFGAWSGRAFADLQGDAQWSVWCTRRSMAQPPGGERIGAVQERAVAALERLAGVHADAAVVLCTHGDVIKAALAHYLGMSLDHLERFDVAPASVSVVVLQAGRHQVMLVNETGRLVAH